MKKLLCIALSLLMVAAIFSGCNSNSDAAKIEKLIDSAIKQNEKLNDLNLTSKTTMYYDYGDTSYYVENSSDLLVHNLKDAKKYEMSEMVSQKSSSSANINNYEVYYKDGYYYTNRYGGSFKSKLNAKDAGIENVGSLINIKYSDMRAVGFKTETEDENSADTESTQKDNWGEGYTAITFTCKNSALSSFVNSAAEDDADDFQDIKIKKGEGEYVINKDGYLVYEKLEVTSVITVEGDEITSKTSSEITYNEIGKEVDPYNPEDKNYVEVESIDDVMAIDSAMSKTLSSNNYVMEMDSSADIVQDKVKVGYTRTFKRQQNMTGSEYLQETFTTYLDNGKKGKTLESSQYYTDGRYYQTSDLYSQKIYSVMDFSKFVSGVYMKSGVSPASVYTTGLMKDIKSKKVKEDTVYNFNLNHESEDGITFLSSIVGPYESFGGNFNEAEIKVNSFSGKTYVNSEGYYYKTEISCDVLVKFSEGDVSMKYDQTITASNINGTVKCDFPELKENDFERMEQSDLLGAFSGESTSSQTE